MREVKKLAGQTIIYGVGTMVPRFLNYVVLTPLFTYTLSNRADYGVIVELYAWMVLLLVVLTYGMETGFFRFSQKAGDEKIVYGTALISLLVTSSLFLLFVNLFIDDVSAFFNYRENKDYIRLFTAIVAIDAFAAIPFAKLRKDNRPVVFSLIKIANVLITVGFIVFFINIAPRLYENGNRLVTGFYNPDFLIGYVFVANFIGSAATLILLLPVIFRVKPTFSLSVWKNMIGYSFPLLIGGMAGSINDVVDKILVRRLTTEGDGLVVVGEYGAGYKIAVLMSLFVQMFRFAAEPFFFEKAGKSDARETYAFVMRYFVITGLVLFIAINIYIPVVQYMVGPIYRESIIVVPIVSFAYFLYGVYLNLSVWYKINDMTRYGAYFAIAGAILTVTINVFLIPVYGYLASAWAHIACYLTMVILSYFAGRKFYRVTYDVKGFMIYSAMAIAIVLFTLYTGWNSSLLKMLTGTVLLAGFIFLAQKRDRVLSLFFKKGKN
ncbi:MAG: polysaccharide biosynthesis C-terminal domain-containing protein [Bacteroidales bacterium]|nr:polysaccharide biosynthesis C-terminal domain-containing protein [Bacteroidales bacterium]